MNKKRTISNLNTIIGSVSQKHEKEIKEESQEIDLLTNQNEKITNSSNDFLMNTTEFKIARVRGLSLQSRVAKMPESFRIKPSLKKIVEEIVKEARYDGQKVNKSQIYNLLIAKGLQVLK